MTLQDDTITAPLPHPSASLEAIVAHVVRPGSRVVTYDQVESAMHMAGYSPFESTDLYQAILEALDQLGVLVTETLANGLANADEESCATELADDVWEMLKSARLPISEYRHPILTSDRERRLLEIVQDSYQAERELADELSWKQRVAAERRVEAGRLALDELVRCNQRLVAKRAARFARGVHHLGLDDLIQVGRMGLFLAITKFDLERQHRLSTYAIWWIDQAIRRAIADLDRAIRLPVYLVELLRRMQRTHVQLTSELDREPTPEELAGALSISLQKLQQLRMMRHHASSLDTIVGGDATTLGELLPDRVIPRPDREVEQRLLQQLLAEALSQMSEREQRILELRFGLVDGQGHTLEEIGEIFGLTRERIRQIESKALRKMRHPRLAKHLCVFLEA
jgi:RNA polymerase primary sigma factor